MLPKWLNGITIPDGITVSPFPGGGVKVARGPSGFVATSAETMRAGLSILYRKTRQ